MSEIADIHAPFIRWLRENGVPFINPRSDRESTIAEGHPDFTLLARNRCLLLEMKTEKGSLSAAQRRRIAELEAAGNTVHVVRDADVAIELATAWLSMLPRDETPACPKERISAPLYRFGDGVWVRDAASGAARRVRTATPADFMLQPL